MENDLNRSLRLLENALTPKSRGLIKIGTPRSERLTLGHSALQETLQGSFSSIVDGNKTITGSAIRKVEPWRQALDSLYLEFLEVLQSATSDHNVLEIVNDLARCCTDAATVVDELKSKVATSFSDEDKWLDVEKATWRLLFGLYQDRLGEQSEDDLQYDGVSEKLCVTNLFRREGILRESQLVVDWLEFNASEKENESSHFSDNTEGWENTLHQLESAGTIVFASSKEVVSSLDPDAPYHEGLALHDLDAADFRKLNRKVFSLIRCGKLNEAQQLCSSCGHSWKAALLEGWRLFHNADIEEDYHAESVDKEGFNTSDIEKSAELMVDDNEEQSEGNVDRGLWKFIALEYCHQSYLDPYERATVAAFCGCLQELLPVCKTWEDTLWAYMRVMIDIRVETEIRDTVHRDYKPLPNFYADQKMSLNDIFVRLESSSNSNIAKESLDKYRIMQKHIILNEIPALLLKLEQWVEEPNISTQFTRFAAHLILFLEQIGQAARKDVDKIVECYVKRLMEMKETQLVTFYIGKLSAHNQAYLCAHYFEGITDFEERKAALRFAEDSGLNIEDITKQVVVNIRNRMHDVGDFSGLLKPITEEDLLKISALEWLLFCESQRSEALYQTNALIFSFLAVGKLEAAQLAFKKIPPDSVEKILAEGALPPEVSQILREFLSYKAYLDAHEAFDVWFKQFNAKPVPPEGIPEHAHFTEKVAYQHRMSQFKAETERWKLSTSHYVKNVKTLLYNVLLFPDGGWLQGAKDAHFLRSRCIPEVVLLLYSVLYESGLYGECVQLADILADRKHSLYKVYSKEKLEEILTKLCDSSVALLNENKDPWGGDAVAS